MDDVISTHPALLDAAAAASDHLPAEAAFANDVPLDNPRRFGDLMWTQFDTRLIPDPSLLDKAIQATQIAADLEQEPSETPQLFFDLGVRLQARYGLTGSLEDLERRTSAFERSVGLTSDDDPEKLCRLNQLGTSRVERFMRIGELEDLHAAITAFSRAVELTPDTDPEKPARISNYGSAVEIRFKKVGELEDIECAIAAQKRADELIPSGHRDKFQFSSKLANSLLTRFERTRDLEDLQQAIAKHRHAVELTPDGHPYKPAWLSYLGCALLTLFKHTKELEDLEQAISAHHRAVELTLYGHPQESQQLNNLGNALLTRFECIGELEDLEQAVSAYRRSVELVPDGHLNKPARFNNLGGAFLMRFERTGELEDLNQAILLHRRAVELAPNRDPHKPTWLNSLGTSFSRAFERSGELEDLEHTVSAFRCAVELMSDDHPDKPLVLHNLCNELRVRFEHTKNSDDIVNAIFAVRRALELSSEESSEVYRYYNGLAGCLQSRFSHTGNIDDIIDAISFSRKAVELFPDNGPRLSSLLWNLGIAQRLLFLRTQTRADFDGAIDSFMKSTQNISGSPFERLRSARRCTLMLSEYPSFSTMNSLLSAHSHIISILPEIVWMGHSIHRRYEQSSLLGELVNAAVSAAITFGSLKQAVEWLEAGRVLIWSQILALRTPLDELHDSYPTLADALRSVQRQLQSSAHSTFSQDIETSSNIPGIMYSSAAENHRSIAIKYDKLMKEIRGCPGFECFLRPKKFDTLIPSLKLADGPFIYMNVHSTRCDALVLSPDGSIMHVVLHDLTEHRAMRLRTLWAAELDARNLRQRAPVIGLPQSSYGGAAELSRLLGLMWRWIVDPILKALGVSQHAAWAESSQGNANCTTKLNRLLCVILEWMKSPVLDTHGWQGHLKSSDHLLHITWCPTGPLTQLPLHAAGLYNDPFGPRAFDLIVSSYVPSLSTFQRSSEGVAKPNIEPSTLIVTQPATPGQARLPGTVAEGRQLEEVLLGWKVRHDTLNDAKATVASVTDIMNRHSWIHFACHGSQHAGDATESAFSLHDGSLSLRDLMGALAADNAELAFLSACQTALGDEKNPEEAAHLAAGMLAVGFKGVVATMWSIGDKDAPVVVVDYYRTLLEQRSARVVEEGNTGAAYALHDAVQVLRKKVGERNFLQWAPFVHFGV
ncbi:TPR-like protein [Peniophora sp. CONT]|nr:TPR-like protein [Peniophora sp. CONT]